MVFKFRGRQTWGISRFTANVEEVLREICLMELVAATLIICLLEYYCMVVREIPDRGDVRIFYEIEWIFYVLFVV